MKKLLIVEDDRSLRDGLSRSLRTDNIDTCAASCIAEAYLRLSENDIDLIVLDCNLPDGNGVDFCAQLRKTNSVPVIFLTVLDSEIDEVSAFRAGGCDYVKKPFSLMVLRERINSALERAVNGGAVYDDGRYYFDFSSLIFRSGECEVLLSPAEQKLLYILVENKRRVVSRASLTERMWACESEYIDENALSVTVKRLRSKLGVNCVKTMYGLGYMWIGENGDK